MTDPLEITPSCGCVHCDLEVEHASEDCGLIRALNGVGIPREQAMAEIRSVIDAARFGGARDEGRDSGSDGQPTEEHIAEIRVLLEERRRGTFLSADEFYRHVVAMLQRKRLEYDLTAVQCWLAARHPSFACLVLDRHYSSANDEIAYVVVFGPSERDERRAIRAEAETAFPALGWRMAPEPGRDVYDVQLRYSDLPAHQRLAAVSRVEEALRDAD